MFGNISNIYNKGARKMALALSHRVSDGPIHFTNKDTGEHFTLNLSDINGNQVRYSIDASQNIDIQRDVIWKKINPDQNN